MTSGRKFLSLGAGVQSSTLYLMSVRGDLPLLDGAIFADTQCEPRHVYDWLAWLEEQGGDRVPIHRASGGDLLADTRSAIMAEAEHNHVPFFVAGSDGRAAPLNRQCTRAYKLDVIRRELRLRLGYAPRQRIKEIAEVWIGISTDEATRMKPSRDRWIEHKWPLCFELRFSRSMCIEWMLEHYGRRPPKSSCIICPYHNDRFWIDLRDNRPEEWDAAVKFDRMLRKGSVCGAKSPAYLHRTMKPLDEVTFKHDGQLDLWDLECEGMCGL
jgi:hypothetical protein